MSELLAHSARHGCPTQPYDEHIRNVVRGALHRARRMLKHYAPGDAERPSRRELLSIIGDATSFHDFGKLDDGFQQTLRDNRYSPRHIRHEDAGVVMLARYGAMEAAGLVGAHHRGLPRYEFERSQPRVGQIRSCKLSVRPFRIDDLRTRAATDSCLDQYRERHENLLGVRKPDRESGLDRCSGLTRRLLLSCLVDSDHFDTARHYRQGSDLSAPDGRWAERLEALDRYVDGLKKPIRSASGDSERLRQEIRDELYVTCRNAETKRRLRSCDAAVGSGKTTAIMAHMLRVAAERRLRHIFVVLPYTNIIRQSVKVYREALCLPGENPESVVAEHHHQAEFKDLDLRGLTTLWRAPIIVTTAVQFFETLAGNQTSKLRKFHELPGSAVFLDEAHAALPAELWPVCWNWLREWTSNWNGHLVLASGSLAEFWKLDEFRSITEGKDSGHIPTEPMSEVAPLSEELREKTRTAEHLRVRFAAREVPLTADAMSEWVEGSPGPRLVIVNTVQSAAVLAKHLRDRDKQSILHLSTALAPIDRLLIVEKIKVWLKKRSDWTLVATSLVEAGLDFSFATGFRQRSSTASLVQTGGRVNRGADKDECSRVWDFDFSDLSMFPDNTKALAASKRALGELFAAGSLSDRKPIDLARVCLDALRMEFKTRQQNAALEFVQLEGRYDYPAVAERCRVIQSDTRTVLVDRQMAERIRLGANVSSQELILNSVQLYHSKIKDLGLESVLAHSEDLFVLPEGWRYDPECYGYMAGWFDLQKLKIAGGYFV